MFSGLNFAPTAQRAEWQTDFREYAPAAQLHSGPFFSRLDHVGTTDNAVSADTGAIGGKSVTMGVTGSSGDTLGYTKPAGASALTDVEVLVLWKVVVSPDATGGAGPVVRLRNSGQDGYNVTPLDSAGKKMEQAEFLNQARTGNIGGQVAVAWDTTNWWWTRLQMIGTTIRSRTWQFGTAEPGTWTISGTDASYADGYVGLMSRPANSLKYAWFSVATGGKTASGPSG